MSKITACKFLQRNPLFNCNAAVSNLPSIIILTTQDIARFYLLYTLCPSETKCPMIIVGIALPSQQGMKVGATQIQQTKRKKKKLDVLMVTDKEKWTEEVVNYMLHKVYTWHTAIGLHTTMEDTSAKFGGNRSYRWFLTKKNILPN